MRRIAVALATLCLLAGQTIFVGAVSAADPSKFTATPLTPDSTFSGAKSHVGRDRPDRPGAARPHRLEARQRHDQVRLRRDRVLRRRRRGLAATSPRVTGKSLKANARGRRRPTTPTRPTVTEQDHRRAEKAVPALEGHVRPSGRPTAASPRQVPANQIGALLKVDGVVAVQQDTLEQPLDDNTAFIGATTVWPSLGGSANAGSNVIVGVIDTGVWPEHPMLAAGQPRRPGRRPQACQFGDGTDVAHLGPAFTCNNKLIGAYAKTADVHGRRSAPDANEFCNNTTASVLGARLRGPRHAHHDDGRRRLRRLGRCSTASSAARSAASPPARASSSTASASRPGCFGSDSVAAVSRRSPTASTSSTSRSRAARSRTPTRSSSRSSTRSTPGISVNASAGNSGPGAGDLRPRRPVGDHGRRLDRPARVPLDAAPDRRRRRDARRPGRHADERHHVGDAGRHGRDAAEGRRRQRGRALPVGPRPGRGDRQGRRLPARRRTAASTRASASSQAARPG